MRFATTLIAVVGTIAALVHRGTARAVEIDHTQLLDHDTEVNHTLEARVNQNYWNEMLAKGCTLLAAMADKNTPESIWQDPGKSKRLTCLS